MVKEDLETKAFKAILEIKNNVKGIYDVINDVGMKFDHIIREKRNYYDMLEGSEYYK